MSPWVIGFLALTLLPMAASLVLSFTDYQLLSPGSARWIGGANYAEAARDPAVRQSLKVTAYDAITEVGLSLVLGLVFALLLNAGMRGIATLRTIYYLPAACGGRPALPRGPLRGRHRRRAGDLPGHREKPGLTRPAPAPGHPHRPVR